jgi:P-type Mg2+ transporter
VPVCVALGLILVISPAGAALGFIAPPLAFFGVLLVMLATYLALVEVAKRWFYQRTVL